jgi:oligosaccharide repeat unit polymerase
MSAASHDTRPLWHGPVVLILAHGCVLGLIGALPWLYASLDLSIEEATYLLCVVFAGLAVWSLVSWMLTTGSWFDPYTIFLAASTAFNGGQVLLEVLGLNEKGLLEGEFHEEVVLDAVYLTTLGTAALHWGALIIASAGSWGTASGPARADSTAATLRLVGWAQLLISLPFNVVQLWMAVQVVMESGYMGLYQRELPTGFGSAGEVLSYCLVPGVFFLTVGSKRAPKSLVAGAVILAAFSLTQLFLGYRYHAVIPVVMYAWLWHHHIRPISPVVLVGGGLALLSIFPLVHAIRLESGSDRKLSATEVRRSFGERNPIVASIYEMGGSLMTVAYTLELVPDVRDHLLGESYSWALLTLFPNLFWDAHPTQGENMPSAWLIWTVDPATAINGGGIGYSYIAEAYLNFGWPGAPPVLALIGVLYAGLCLWGWKDPARMAVVATTGTFFTLIARGEAALFVRTLGWYAFGPYLMVLLISQVIRRRERPAADVAVPISARPAA